MFEGIYVKLCNLACNFFNFKIVGDYSTQVFKALGDANYYALAPPFFIASVFMKAS